MIKGDKLILYKTTVVEFVRNAKMQFGKKHITIVHRGTLDVELDVGLVDVEPFTYWNYWKYKIQHLLK